MTPPRVSLDMRNMRKTISVGSLVASLAASSTALAAQPVLNRSQLREQLAAQFPMPVEPSAPVQPRKPGVFGSSVAGLLVGSGAFVGTAALCGKTTLVGASPLGSKVNGQYLAPGEVREISANSACTAGAAIGSAISVGWLTQRIRTGGFRRAMASFETEVQNYPAARASWERAVAARTKALDSAVTVAVVEAERAALSERTRVATAAPNAGAPNSAGISRTVNAVPMIPTVRAPKTNLINDDAVAVVIGNSAYTRAEVPSVDYAGRDAAAMREFLVQTFGFRDDNIIFEENASFTTLQRIFGTKDDFKGQLFGYLPSTKPVDIFIFYSGHGAPDPGTGTAYLVPTDADPQAIRLTGYPVRQLYANLALLPAKSITVVMDACFSGLADRGSLVRGISPLTVRVENPVLASENAVVLTASQSSEVSGWYDQQQHGLFTYVLLNTLAQSITTGTSDSLLTARQLNATVGAEVLRLSRRIRQRDQNPQVYGLGSDAPLAIMRRP